MNHRSPLKTIFVFIAIAAAPASFGDTLPLVEDADPFALTQSLRRIIADPRGLGRSISAGDRMRLEQAFLAGDVEAIQDAADSLCLLGVEITAEARVKVEAGPVSPRLHDSQSSAFLVKIHNVAGSTSALRISCNQGGGADAWLRFDPVPADLGTGPLTGQTLEYRILRLKSRELGHREARLSVDVGQGTQDLGFRGEVDILFSCREGDTTSEFADLVISNARVVTLDVEERVAEAVAIKHGRIVALGTSAEMQSLIGPETENVDAKGRTLLPGLYDSHVHPLGAATSEKDHAIPSFRSLADIMAYINERAKIQPKGTWIVVRYAFPTRLDESRFPSRAELDAIAPDHPVLHQAGPAGMVNSNALQLSGITPETPDPPAGRVVRDPKTGEATGLIRNAYSVLKGLPTFTSADDGEADRERIKDLFRRYNERGITSVGDRSASNSALEIYRDLRDRGELSVRVNATRVMDTPPGERTAIVDALKKLASDGAGGEPNGPTGVGDHWVRVGPLKLFLDGGMLNGTAYMRTPWGVGPAYQITEPDYRGLLFVPPEPLALIAEEAARRGWRMTAHVAGEAAMDELLKAYRHADRAVGIRGRRWLITHANFTSADNLALCRELGVGADLQPAWIWKDTRTLKSLLGPERMAWFHPYRKWLDAGLTIGGGSDHMIRLDPIEATNPWDPWLGIYVAVTRETEGAGVLNPDQRLTRNEALRFYTINNARLHFEDHDKGTIEPGKLADLILVSPDPFTCPEAEIRNVRVLRTWVDGKTVFSSN